jgi:NAD-dependent DNA ligase
MLKSEIKKFMDIGWEKATRSDFDSFLDYIDDAYYNKAKKPITDDQYDLLKENYFARFPKSKRKAKVGHSTGNKRAEVKLPNPMSSLDKIKEPKKIDLFAKKYAGPWVVSDKEDGMSLQLIYFNGVPSELYTRGNGLKGQDISHLIPYLRIPKRIGIKTPFAIRIEGIVENAAFEKHLSKKSGGDFTAVRNAAGGIINKLPSSKDFDKYAAYAKHMTLFAFKILEGKGYNLKPSKQFELLDSLGFKVVPYKIVDTLNFDILSSLLSERLKASKYDIDGLVVEQDKYHAVGHSLPKHAVSFKENNAASMVDIKVKDVVWEASRNGILIPVVTIEPTKIGGVMVSNFTGHNAFYIQHGYKSELKSKPPYDPRPLGKGAIIRAVRSGGVIPYIVEVVKAARKPQMPDVEYKRKGIHVVLAGKQNIGKELQTQKKIEHFFVRIGVDGFKLSTVQRFWDNGYTKLSQFLKLKKKDFVNIDGLGERKAEQFEQSLTKALSELDFVKLADASGYLPNFGTRRFQMIVDAYPDVMAWPKSRMSDQTIVSKIQQLSGFNELAYDFADGLPKIVKFADTFGLNIKQVKKVIKGSKFAGLNVTFTGVRDLILGKTISEQGGTVQDWRKDTNLVLIKEVGFTSSTVEKAQDAGVKILTVDQFKKKYKVL